METTCSGWGVRTVLAISTAAVLALPASLGAQEEQSCELEGTALTGQAEDQIDRAFTADTAGNTTQARALYRTAMTRLQLAFRQNKDDPTAFWLAGRAQLGLDDFVAADTLFDRFIELKPGCASLTESLRYSAWADTYNEGIRTYRAGQDSVALSLFRKANVIREDARSLNNVALLLQRQGDLEAAEQAYRRAREIAEEPEQLRVATINLAELLRSSGDVEASMAMYETYLTDYPDDVTAAINYAVGLRQMNRADSAEAVFRALLQKEDMDFQQWYNVAVGLLSSQSYEAARTALQRARALQPHDKRAMVDLMDVNLALQNNAQAAALGDTLVRWYPYEPDLYRSLMQALDRQGQTSRVQQLLPILQNMPLEFPQLDMVRQGEDRYVIRGQVSGRSAAGSTVRVPFELLGPEGQVLESKTVQIQLPGQDEVANFELQFQTEQQATGFRYGRVQGAS